MSKDNLRQSHSAWRDIAVTQLSNANNVILGFATGFILFCVVFQDTMKISCTLAE